MANKKTLRKSSPVLLLLALAVALAASMASASVFVYYPLTANIVYTPPSVEVQAGSNAGRSDLGGTTITVNIGQNRTSAEVTIHPTYQTTYYKDVLRIVNTDTQNTFYVYIRVTQAATNIATAGGSLQMIVNGTSIDLTRTETAGPFTLGPNQLLVVDIKSTLPEGIKLPNPDTVRIQVIYTGSPTETPP